MGFLYHCWDPDNLHPTCLPPPSKQTLFPSALEPHPVVLSVTPWLRLSATPRSVLGVSLFSVFITYFWISAQCYNKAVPPLRWENTLH